jgi:MoxR-like ATPase
MGKEFNVGTASFEKHTDVTKFILNNSAKQQDGNGSTGVLLAGDPGVGKTSFVKFFAQLVGLQLVTIEAPHITEEHIINIPFIVFDPKNKSEKKGNAEINDSDYEIILSKSHLISQLEHAVKISDNDYIASIKNASPDIKKVYEELGGTDDEPPKLIKRMRDQFKVILFLDEYFRQTSPRIRNMLRNILNGKIGTDEIPEDAYVMFASNLNDEGGSVEDIPLNNDFERKDFDDPDKEDWFNWLVGKFEEDKHVKLNKKVIDAFYTAIEQEDINHKDIANEVKTSPRRWEQLILYVNASIPVKNEHDAKGLISNVKLNFKNYLTGDHSSIVTKITDAVVKLINETTPDIKATSNTEHEGHEWRDTLQHQIETKMKLGEHRKYIPIMSGLPGLGKTTEARRVANSLNLRFIDIDCSTLDPEDVKGIPLLKNKSKSETKFSTPKLHQKILNDIEKEDKRYLESASKEDAAKYKKEHWKYLIFFDELNRTSTKVFNGLRRVLLEKNFGDDLKLPEGSIIIAAINPHDIGTNQLTHHMRDVVDIIDTGVSWDKTKKYLSGMKFPHAEYDSSKDIALNALMAFVDKFRVKKSSKEITNAQKSFYLDAGAEPVYISPREYTTIFASTVGNLDSEEEILFKKHKDLSKLDADQLQALEEKLRKTVFKSFEATLKNIFTKQNAESPEFMHSLEQWFMHSQDIDIGKELFNKKVVTASFEKIVKPYFDGHDKNLSDEIEFVNYIKNSEPHTFKEDLVDFFEKELKSDEDVIEKILKKKVPKKTRDGEVFKFEKEEVSKFEHFIRELIHTLDIHEIANDRREIIRITIKDLVAKVKEEHLDDLLMITGKLFSFIKGAIK